MRITDGNTSAIKWTAVAVAALVALQLSCSREPPGGYTRSALPRTCDPARFTTAASSFEDLASRRNTILARIEAVPMDEPVHYLRELAREQEAMRGLVGEAQKVEVPRCLQPAKEMFGHYLEQSLAAMDLRRPDRELAAYKFAQESNEGIRGQFESELKQQARNQQ